MATWRLSKVRPLLWILTIGSALLLIYIIRTTRLTKGQSQGQAVRDTQRETHAQSHAQSHSHSHTPHTESHTPHTESHTPHAESHTQEQVFAERRMRYEAACRQMSANNVTARSPTNVYYHAASSLSYCEVQKVGCTYWKRIFYFLANDTGSSSVRSPFDIERFYIHHVNYFSSRVPRLNYNKAKDVLDSTIKAMFTRDPYARLWSMYVDKFVLPDSWLDLGRNIVNRRPGNHTRCPDDITFPEFVDFALHVASNVHWNPVHTVCDPCAFRPVYLGKVETFSKDAAFILQRAGLSHVVQGHGSASHASDEVSMLTDYMFSIYRKREKQLRPCLDEVGLAERLWRAFVLNGYIGQELAFPRQKLSEQLKDVSDRRQVRQTVRETLLEAQRYSPPQTSQQRMEHRRHVLVENFRAVGESLLEDIVKRYRWDFALFGYDARPSDIFSPHHAT